MTLHHYSVRVFQGRGSARVVELASVIWLCSWALAFTANPTLMQGGDAWRLMRHVPQPYWAYVCALLAAVQITSFARRSLSRPVSWAAALFYALIGGGFIVSQPWTTILAPVLTMAAAMVFLALEGPSP